MSYINQCALTPAFASVEYFNFVLVENNVTKDEDIVSLYTLLPHLPRMLFLQEGSKICQ